MKDFIPENILVYIAVDNSHRKGYGKQLMEKAISIADGNIALHVDQIILQKNYTKTRIH
jgi:hypothetical protein